MNAGVAQATKFRDRYLTTLILRTNPRGFEPHSGMRRPIRAARGGDVPGGALRPTTIAGAADLECASRKLRRLKSPRRGSRSAAKQRPRFRLLGVKASDPASRVVRTWAPVDGTSHDQHAGQ